MQGTALNTFSSPFCYFLVKVVGPHENFNSAQETYALPLPCGSGELVYLSTEADS